MCSIQEENEVLEPLKRDGASPKTRKCMKCDNYAVVIIRMNDAMCSGCFVEYTTHKFRSAFGKSKVVRDQEKVLVAFSGGSASCAMVHLIQGGLSKRAQKKLRFIPSLVYIDEGLLTKRTLEERQYSTEGVVHRMRDTGLSYSAYCLEQVMNSPEPEVAAPVAASSENNENYISPIVCEEDDEVLSSMMGRLSVNETSADKLRDLLNGTKSLTAKENLLAILRLRLVCSVARQQNIKKVLLGDSATRLSVHLLSSIAQGTGAHLPYKISFADNRYGDVVLIRPLREFTSKEVAIYNELNNVKSLFIPNLSTKAPTSSSIERLTEGFVAGLQAEYPNTVSTIFRTGEKFALSQETTDSVERCCMCQCPLDTRVPVASALSATRFSQSLCANMAASRVPQPDPQTGHIIQGGSVGGPGGGCHADSTTQGDNCCGNSDGSCHMMNSRLTWAELESWLCYGCQLTVKDMDLATSLPTSLVNEAALKMRRAAMKNEISEFLLDD